MASRFTARPVRAGLLALALALPASAADDIDQALDASLAAQRAARESQARINRIDSEIRALREKQRAAHFQSLQLAVYAEQLEQEAKVEERKRESLEAELRRIGDTGKDLLPLLRRMVAELDEFVAQDLPFLHETRKQRVGDLGKLLDDPDRRNAEKFRRVLEAYRTEVDYGYTLGTEDIEVDCGGRRGPATLVRIGRAALYCLSGDGSRAGHWDVRGQAWRALEGDAVDEVQRAVAIARREAPAELLVLPVRAPERGP